MAAYCQVYGEVTCGLTAKTPGPAPSPMQISSMGLLLPLHDKANEVLDIVQQHKCLLETNT